MGIYSNGSRSPHGERGLKFLLLVERDCRQLRRSPHGERGLKFTIVLCNSGLVMSLPTRGAWIEINISISINSDLLSLPTRGAWIEISDYFDAITSDPVAPHTGSVD